MDDERNDRAEGKEETEYLERGWKKIKTAIKKHSWGKRFKEIKRNC